MATTRRASEGNSKRRSLCQHHVDPRPFDPSRPTSLLGVRPKSARYYSRSAATMMAAREQARFVVINFGHYVGCIEDTTRLRSIGWRFYQSYRCYHRRKAPSPCPKQRAAPNRFTSPPPPHLWCLARPCRGAIAVASRALLSPLARDARPCGETRLARCPAPSSRARGFIGHPLAVERAADQLCPNRLATIVDAGSARLLAVSKRLQQIA